MKNFVYSLLDLVTFGRGISRRINGMKIRFPARWSRYYESDYEKENYTFLQQQLKPGMQLLDIGAHLGLFSVTSSRFIGPSGKIICFEPTPATYAILQETLRLNHCTNVTAMQAAVSDKEGTATFYVSEMAGCNSNSLVNNDLSKNRIGYDVKLVTIDNVVSSHSFKPSLIKIDAEGAELDVLKGGINTFRSYKPVLILGLHPAFIHQKGDSLEAIWDLLKSNHYDIKMEGRTLTKNEFCSNELFFDVHCF